MTDRDSTNRDENVPDWEAIARYLAGESPAEERRAVAEWLAAHREEGALVAALGLTAGLPAADVPADGVLAHGATDDIDVGDALARVKRRIESDLAGAPAARERRPLPRLGGAKRPTTTSSPRTVRRLTWATVAVAAAAGIVLAAVLVKDGGESAVVSAEAREYATVTGAVDSVQLADGSLAILAPHSTLRVPAGFGVSSRQVELEGEAWFSVVHDDARPFTVRANDAIIRDIGTRFAVQRQVADSSSLSISVYEGTVAVRHARGQSQEAVLEAGDRGIVGSATVLVERNAADSADLSWLTRRLAYRDAPLARVQDDLRRWHGIELVVADSSLAARRLTATFAADSVTEILDVLALALGGRIERQGDTATLRDAAAR